MSSFKREMLHFVLHQIKLLLSLELKQVGDMY